MAQIKLHADRRRSKLIRGSTASAKICDAFQISEISGKCLYTGASRAKLALLKMSFKGARDLFY